MPDELTSWKEIAGFLGVSIKTAQLWERDRSLPVHRLPGQRSVVRALPEELIAWREQSITAPPAADLTTAPTPRRFSYLLIALLAVSTAAIVLFVVVRYRPRNPATIRFQNNSMIVADAHGSDLWQTTYPSLESRSSSPYLTGRYYQIVDLDNDGSTEVLFSQQPVESMSPERALWCYNADGSVRWKFQPGRQVRTSSQSLPPPFRILTIAVGPLAPNGPTKIVVSSLQVPWWANQIAVLDTNGKLEREYWHSGALFSLELGDANSDGFSEIYAGGINNARREATLIVLDPRSMKGASLENDPAFQLLDFPPPVEQARLFFPRSCAAYGQPYNAVRHITIASNSVTAETWEHPYGPEAPTIFYYFDQNLNFLRSAVSDLFRSTHEQLHASAKVDHALTGKEISSLRPQSLPTPSK